MLLDDPFSSVFCHGMPEFTSNPAAEQFLKALLKYTRTFETCNFATFSLKGDYNCASA